MYAASPGGGFGGMLSKAGSFLSGTAGNIGKSMSTGFTNLTSGFKSGMSNNQGQQGQGGGFLNKVGSMAGSFVNSTGDKAKSAGNFVKTAAPWAAGLAAAGTIAAGIGAAKFMAKDHSRD